MDSTKSGNKPLFDAKQPREPGHRRTSGDRRSIADPMGRAQGCPARDLRTRIGGYQIGAPGPVGEENCIRNTCCFVHRRIRANRQGLNPRLHAQRYGLQHCAVCAKLLTRPLKRSPTPLPSTRSWKLSFVRAVSGEPRGQSRGTRPRRSGRSCQFTSYGNMQSRCNKGSRRNTRQAWTSRMKSQT